MPVTGAVGMANTVNGKVFEHPSDDLVYVNVTAPAEFAVTSPALDTVATELLLEAQVPLVVGVTLAVRPAHILAAPPTTGAPGTALIVIIVDEGDVHKLLFVTVSV